MARGKRKIEWYLDDDHGIHGSTARGQGSMEDSQVFDYTRVLQNAGVVDGRRWLRSSLMSVSRSDTHTHRKK
jgi:hypothetical protein